MRYTLQYEWPLFKVPAGYPRMEYDANYYHRTRNAPPCPNCAEGVLIYSVADDREHCQTCDYTQGVPDNA